MGQVIVVLWKPSATPVRGVTLMRAAEAAGWRTAHHDRGTWVGVTGRRSPAVRVAEDGRLLTIGEVFWKTSNRVLGPADDDLAIARNLVDGAWGRYIALFGSPEKGVTSILRDPSGSLDCAFWMDGPCTIVASCLPEWLGDASSLPLRPDLERVADILADPTLISGPVALEGVTTVAPGEWRAFDGRNAILWRPAAIARSDFDPEENGSRALRSAVENAVEHLAAGAALVEVSGGLDSAIVATTRHHLNPERPTVWTNTWGPFAEADERAYARAICDRVGVDLTSVERSRPVGSDGLCLEHPRALRPSVNRMDAGYDRAQAALIRDRGLDLVLTGKGGDVAFYQTATSAVLADLLRDRGVSAVNDPCLPVLARRLRRSAWSVLWRALTASGRARRFGGSGRPALGLVHGDIANRKISPHPWLQDLGDVAPGKRQQITGFAGNLSLHGLSARTEAADLVHPLLSQPVMETSLRLPSWVLTGSGHDRLLARQAFADRLPPEILNRRSKGELAAYYGHVVAAATDDLLPHLLEGRLAAAGLIDRAQVEAALRPDHLIWQGGYGDLMMLALIESWLRGWD
jgi:asparagine synthase (glutamine-hydrolysing)